MAKSFRSTLLFFFCILLLTACGGGGNSSPDGDESPPADTDFQPPDGDGPETPDGDEEDAPDGDADPETDADGDEDPDLDDEPDDEPEPDEDIIVIETERDAETCENGPDALCFQNAGPGVSGYKCIGFTLARCEPSLPVPPVCATSICRCQPERTCTEACIDDRLDGSAYCREDPPDGDAEPDADPEPDIEEDGDDDHPADGDDTDGDAVDGDTADGDAETDDDTSTDGDADSDPEPDADPDPDLPACEPDGQEVNDYALLAPLLVEDLDWLTICSGDQDWFRLELEPGDTLNAAIDYPDGGADLALYLMDNQEFNQILAQGQSARVRRKQLQWTVDYSGSHYLVVNAPSGGVNTYNISFEVIPGADGDTDVSEFELQEAEIEKAEPEPDPCPDDGFEPNNTREEAAPVAGIRYNDLELCPGDQDWYSIRLSQYETVTIDLFFIDRVGNLDLYVYNEAGTLVTTGGSETDNEQVTFIAENGMYYLKVHSLFGEQNVYDLQLSIVPSPLCADDRYDDSSLPGYPGHDNDARANAPLLAVGEYSDLVLCGYDPDWYAFDVGAGQGFKLELFFSHLSGNIDAALYDGTGELLDASAGQDDGETLVYNAEADTRVYAQVYNVNPTDQTYSMTATVQAEHFCNQDDYEPNDNFQDAAVLDGIQLELDDLAACASEEDWFAFDLGAGSIFEARVLHDYPDNPFRITLLDEDGTTVAYSSEIAGGRYTRKTVANDGLYRYRIQNQTAENRYYDLEVNICPEDGYEPNNVWTDSYLLAGPDTLENLALCSGDEDWFSVNAPGGQTVRIRLIFEHRQGDLDLFLRDGFGNILTQSTSSNNDEQVLYYTATGGGLYIQIVGYGEDQNTYTLIYSLE